MKKQIVEIYERSSTIKGDTVKIQIKFIGSDKRYLFLRQYRISALGMPYGEWHRLRWSGTPTARKLRLPSYDELGASWKKVK